MGGLSGGSSDTMSDMPNAYTGWLRLPRRPWQRATEGHTWAACWDRLAAIHLQVPFVEKIVCRAGIRPEETSVRKKR